MKRAYTSYFIRIKPKIKGNVCIRICVLACLNMTSVKEGGYISVSFIRK